MPDRIRTIVAAAFCDVSGYQSWISFTAGDRDAASTRTRMRPIRHTAAGPHVADRQRVQPTRVSPPSHPSW